MATYRVAVIPGDGIGKEVVPEGLRVLEAGGRKFDISFTWDEFPWSCEYRAKHGRMMPADGPAVIRHHDAIFFGACGFPGVPDHISLWELRIPMRRQFDLYINLRPVRLCRGSSRRWPTERSAMSSSGWCAKIPRASTLRSADASSKGALGRR